ncbi:HAD family hydrolase [Salinispirillum marinum]|uniref:HAD family hydrolase n=2 Tax=Saccharospirillaceae TaxID=255527 RepID=A0ABV8BJF5_9GAMM
MTMSPLQPTITTIAFDADDTLWHNEYLFRMARTEFQQLLTHYHSPSWVDEHLNKTEIKNLAHYGYGVKSFALSMIETAVELTEGRISGADVQRILDLTQTMLRADVTVIEGVPDVLEALFPHYRLLVITKGDLLDQQAKLARSGLSSYFAQVEVVSEKDPDTYAQILLRHGVEPTHFVMVGNSMKSDILPVLAIGAQAIHVPHELIWEHEVVAAPPKGTSGFSAVEQIGDVLTLLGSA